MSDETQIYDLHAELRSVHQPALLMAGEMDGVRPKTMRGMAGVIPDARFDEFPGAGHLSRIEHPTLLNAAVAAFLAGGHALHTTDA